MNSFGFLVWKYFMKKQKSKDTRRVPDKYSSATGNLRDMAKLNAWTLLELGYTLGQVSSWSCCCASVRKETNTSTTCLLTNQSKAERQCAAFPLLPQLRKHGNIFPIYGSFQSKPQRPFVF